MKSLIIFLTMGLLNCMGNSTTMNNTTNKITPSKKDSAIYLNNNFKIIIYSQNNMVEKFKLYKIEKKFIVEGKPELVIIDGEIPEGTNRIDYNNPDDYKGFTCDSTYQFISKNLKISFAIEKKTKKRMDLNIYDSHEKALKDGSYTLINQK
ncbi:hypothetical protein [Chryseobacterium sp. GP-SGM7]|uniref:hypothetical protein n=1 Tax=Chryseobacterium sp. GP-SGM7 TaxID=3411323 RepID=UPI003B95A059